MRLIIICAVWCPNCIVLKERMKELYTKGVDITHLDVDSDEEEVSKYNIESFFPVFIIEDEEGNEVKRFTGDKTLSQLNAIINICK